MQSLHALVDNLCNLNLALKIFNSLKCFQSDCALGWGLVTGSAVCTCEDSVDLHPVLFWDAV